MNSGSLFVLVSLARRPIKIVYLFHTEGLCFIDPWNGFLVSMSSTSALICTISFTVLAPGLSFGVLSSSFGSQLEPFLVSWGGPVVL